MASLLQELAAPSAYPVALVAAKAWLREPSSDWDSDITDLLQGAVMHAESISHNHLVYRPVREHFDVFRPFIELSGFPVRGVTQVQYLDTTGTWQILDPTSYRVDIFSGQARVTPEYGKFFPPWRLVINSIMIDYDTGLLCPITAIDTGTGNITIPGHNKAVGDQVQFSVDGAASLPTQLTAGTVYYVVAAPDTKTIQVSATSGGAAIVPSAGVTGGTAFLGILDPRMKQALRLMVNAWRVYKTDVIAGQIAQLPTPYGVESLLTAFSPRGF